MLSKKMTVSLMSLIAIFAFAFVVTPAMAVDDFDAEFSVINKVYATAIEVTLTFKEAVDFTDADKLKVVVQIEDMTGARSDLTTALTATDITLKDTNASLTGDQFNNKAFKFTIPAGDTNADDKKVHLFIPAGVKRLPPDQAKTSKQAARTIDLVAAIPVNTSRPMVVSIQRLRPGSQTVVAAFQEAEVTGAFDVRIVLTEKAFKPGKGDAINAADIAVTNGTASGWTVGVPFSRIGGALATPPAASELASTVRPHPVEGMYDHDGLPASGLAGVPGAVASPSLTDHTFVPLPTGADDLYYQYRVKITPHRRADMVKVSVKEFHDNASPFPNVYKPFNIGNKPNGREELRLKVNIPKFNLEDGLRVYLPHSEGARITYANSKAGHYILTKDKDGSSIRHFHEKDEENNAQKQTPAQLLYNVRASGDLPNLETFLANDGTIHLVSYVRDGANPKYKMGDAYISEVMWGTDASQDPVSNSNWIEIRNGTSAAIGVGEKMWALWFYEAHETPATAYPASSAYEGPTGQAGEIIDVIGTKASDTGFSWPIAGKGRSGRSNIDIARDEEHVLAPTTPLKSMYRVMVADTPGDGTMSSSWMESTGPSVNLAIGRENAIIATPGAAQFDTPDEVQAKKDEQEAKDAEAQEDADKIANTGTYPMGGDGLVYISEVMFAGGGTLPQWIEISNGDVNKAFNLSGWTITVDNAAADADVSIGASATFTIPDKTMIDPSGQHDTPSTILVVTAVGRTDIDDGPGNMGANQIIVLDEIELITAGVLTSKYTLLSDEAFLITLAPPKPAATKPPAGETEAAKVLRQANEKKATANRRAATDMVGNLGKDSTAAWALPMNTEGGRSSIIRKHIQVVRGNKAAEDGMMEENWVLASTTSFLHGQSYYGAVSDVGTPGFRAGGALPVELSQFRPVRDKTTGAVVITWSTQSELNNAGFFIKRSQQKDGEFKVINAAMIPGAGTTSEKQFYAYTDTTAQPNVVYYYQIEDVSLDGNRQTLTRGIRLKGHIGAAGKLTSTWGELKTSNE